MWGKKKRKKALLGHVPTVILQKQTYSEVLLDRNKKQQRKKKAPVKVIKPETSYGLTRLSVASNNPR